MGTAQAHRYIDRHGISVQLANYQVSGTLAASGRYEWGAGSTVTTNAVHQLRSDARREVDASGAVPVVDGDFAFKDTETVRDGGGTTTTRASEIIKGNQRYLVTLADDQNNGLIVAAVQRMDR